MIGRLWIERKLEGKIEAVFTSKEAKLLSMLLLLPGHGTIVLCIPSVKELFKAGSY